MSKPLSEAQALFVEAFRRPPVQLKDVKDHKALAGLHRNRKWSELIAQATPLVEDILTWWGRKAPGDRRFHDLNETARDDCKQEARLKFADMSYAVLRGWAPFIDGEEQALRSWLELRLVGAIKDYLRSPKGPRRKGMPGIARNARTKTLSFDHPIPARDGGDNRIRYANSDASTQEAANAEPPPKNHLIDEEGRAEAEPGIDPEHIRALRDKAGPDFIKAARGVGPEFLRAQQKAAEQTAKRGRREALKALEAFFASTPLPSEAPIAPPPPAAYRDGTYYYVRQATPARWRHSNGRGPDLEWISPERAALLQNAQPKAEK